MGESLFNKWYWKIWTSTYMQKNEIGPLYLLTPYTKISSKWIKDLNVRPEPVKILEKGTGGNFSDISHSNFFLEVS